MPHVFEPMPVPAVPVHGENATFAVHRVFCVGQNYADHAAEMGASGREAPFFFMKPSSSLVPVGSGREGQVPYPDGTQSLHHEVELVVAIGLQGGRHRHLRGGRLHLRLRRGAGPDPARPAGSAEGKGPAVGDRQGLRGLRSDRPDHPQGKDR